MNRRTAIRRLATFFLTTASLAEAQQAMRFEFIISLPASKRIGHKIPYELLWRANQVIK